MDYLITCIANEHFMELARTRKICVNIKSRYFLGLLNSATLIKLRFHFRDVNYLFFIPPLTILCRTSCLYNASLCLTFFILGFLLPPEFSVIFIICSLIVFGKKWLLLDRIQDVRARPVLISFSWKFKLTELVPVVFLHFKLKSPTFRRLISNN